MVGDTRIELVTSSVSGKRSSSELITLIELWKMVGDTRIELVTSSVSGKRSSSELITHRVTATNGILPFHSLPVK